jgi:hypothetical protein
LHDCIPKGLHNCGTSVTVGQSAVKQSEGHTGVVGLQTFQHLVCVELIVGGGQIVVHTGAGVGSQISLQYDKVLFGHIVQLRTGAGIQAGQSETKFPVHDGHTTVKLVVVFEPVPLLLVPLLFVEFVEFVEFEELSELLLCNLLILE